MSSAVAAGAGLSVQTSAHQSVMWPTPIRPSHANCRGQLSTHTHCLTPDDIHLVYIYLSFHIIVLYRVVAVGIPTSTRLTMLSFKLGTGRCLKLMNFYIDMSISIMTPSREGIEVTTSIPSLRNCLFRQRRRPKRKLPHRAG